MVLALNPSSFPSVRRPSIIASRPSNMADHDGNDGNDGNGPLEGQTGQQPQQQPKALEPLPVAPLEPAVPKSLDPETTVSLLIHPFPSPNIP